MKKLVAKPQSQKNPESRRGTKTYLQFNSMLLLNNSTRVGQILRTSARMEKKALKVILSGFYNTGLWEAKRRQSPKLHALVDHMIHWSFSHNEGHQP